jgi:hypothetical protein
MLADMLVGLLAAVAGFLAAIWLLLLWVGDRTATAFELSPPHLDPIRGSRDRIVIYEGDEPIIPMPERLKTREEMVAWMTTELPKLTADLTRSGR